MARQELIGVYRLLARSLAYPDENFVWQVRDAIGQLPVDYWNSPHMPFSELIEGLGHMAQLPLEQIQGEYTRLFMAAFPQVPCPPYESVYLEGRLMGDAAEVLDSLYRRWGLVVDGEDVDHAGAELEFEAFLLALDTPDSQSAAVDFLKEHLLTWLPQLASDIVRESNLLFYRSVGRLLVAILEEHAALVLPNAIRTIRR